MTKYWALFFISDTGVEQWNSIEGGKDVWASDFSAVYPQDANCREPWSRVYAEPIKDDDEEGVYVYVEVEV